MWLLIQDNRVIAARFIDGINHSLTVTVSLVTSEHKPVRVTYLNANFPNPFHLFPSVSCFDLLHHYFTLNSKLTILPKPFHRISFTIDALDRLPRLMGPFSISTLLISFSSYFWCIRLNMFTSFSVHTETGNFIIVVIL